MRGCENVNPKGFVEKPWTETRATADSGGGVRRDLDPTWPVVGVEEAVSLADWPLHPPTTATEHTSNAKTLVLDFDDAAARMVPTRTACINETVVTTQRGVDARRRQVIQTRVKRLPATTRPR